MSHLIEIPAYVADEVKSRWREAGSQWVRGAQGELEDLCQSLDAEPERLLPSRYGLVVAVRVGQERLVVKGSPDPDGLRQAQVLDAFARRGVAPTIRAITSTSIGYWVVMDRVLPGNPLGELGASKTSEEELAKVLRPLVGQSAPTELAYIGDWLRHRLEDETLSDLAPGRSVASKEERLEALNVLGGLTPNGVRGLCHGDASPGNILLGKGRRLFLVDPRGMSGEVAYDVAVLGLKSARQRISHLAEVAGVDADRALAWATVATAARV